MKTRIVTFLLLLGATLLSSLALGQRVELDYVVAHGRVYTVSTRIASVYSTTELRCRSAVDQAHLDHQRALNNLDDLIRYGAITKEDDKTWLRDNVQDAYKANLERAYEERNTWVASNLEYVQAPPAEFREELIVVEEDVFVYRPYHRVVFDCDRDRRGRYVIKQVEYRRPFEGYVGQGPHGARLGERLTYNKSHVSLVHNDVIKVAKGNDRNRPQGGDVKNQSTTIGRTDRGSTKTTIGHDRIPSGDQTKGGSGRPRSGSKDTPKDTPKGSGTSTGSDRTSRGSGSSSSTSKGSSPSSGSSTKSAPKDPPKDSGSKDKSSKDKDKKKGGG